MESNRSRTSEGQTSRYSNSWQSSAHGGDLAEGGGEREREGECE